MDLRGNVFNKKITNKLIIGDLAGRFTELIKIVDQSSKTQPFSVGDLIDKGPNSKLILDFFMKEGQAVIGNHDHMAINFYFQKHIYTMESWILGSGTETILSFCDSENDKRLLRYYKEQLQSLSIHNEIKDSAYAPILAKILEIMRDVIPSKYMEYLNSLPLIYQDKNIIITHAPIDPGNTLEKALDIENNLPNSVLWFRGSPKRMDKIQFHGHNANKEVKIKSENDKIFAVNLDTTSGQCLSAYDGIADKFISSPYSTS